MAEYFIAIFGYSMMYLGYPFLDKNAFDLFETDEKLNQLNTSETIVLHGNYRNFSYKHCSRQETNETCYDITKEYPTGIQFYHVGVWLHWELLLFYSIPFYIIWKVCTIWNCCYTNYLLLVYLMLGEFVNAAGFIFYVEAIGRSIGFQWKDVTYFYYFGVISPLKLIFTICLLNILYVGFKKGTSKKLNHQEA